MGRIPSIDPRHLCPGLTPPVFQGGLLRPYFENISFYSCLFSQINADRFDAMWPKLCVLARSKPSDKFTLVKEMMHSTIKPAGEIVAVTGSGANDGPVLRMADVGFTMASSSFFQKKYNLYLKLPSSMLLLEVANS